MSPGGQFDHKDLGICSSGIRAAVVGLGRALVLEHPIPALRSGPIRPTEDPVHRWVHPRRGSAASREEFAGKVGEGSGLFAYLAIHEERKSQGWRNGRAEEGAWTGEPSTSPTPWVCDRTKSRGPPGPGPLLFSRSSMTAQEGRPCPPDRDGDHPTHYVVPGVTGQTQEVRGSSAPARTL